MTWSKRALLVDKFRHLSQKIGGPISSWKGGGTVFKIYRGKNLYESQWRNKAIKDLIYSARQMSNLPYGRPLMDKYDAKSALYIGSATYPLLIGSEYFFVEEWLSVRLVPGNGDPRGTGELEIYTCQGESVENIVKDRFFQGNDDFLNFIVASNRMCGCRPYLKNRLDEGRITADFLPVKIKHTAILYALINKHFVEDYLVHFNSKYITGVIIDQLVDRSLTINIGLNRYGVNFTYAHEVLGVAPDEIRLDRSINGHYTYRYPAYFLNIRQLVGWLDDLVKKGILTTDSIDHYLKTKLHISEINKQPYLHLDCFKNLHRLFLAEGKIFGSELTGAELRSLADAEVEDGPKLRITTISDLTSSIAIFLNAAGIK